MAPELSPADPDWIRPSTQLALIGYTSSLIDKVGSVSSVRSRIASVAPHDYAAVGRLLHDFNTEYGEPTPSAEWLAGRLADLVADGCTEVLVVEVESDGRRAVVGCVVLRFRPALWSAADECHLAELYVQPPWRGRGLGRQLLRAAMDVARSRGADYLDLGTGEDDVVARALYESEGFSRSGGDVGGPVNYYYERKL